jgi:hypothetical protein
MIPDWRRIAVVAAMAAAAIFLRLAFWEQTGETLEDSLITLRYAENISSGLGFVYNTGDQVLGTTTPLWTLTLAALRTAGVHDLQSAAKATGIACDVATLLLLLWMMRNEKTSLPVFFGLLFATSPWIVRISVSGMETPLLLFSMTLAMIGLDRHNWLFGIGLALTILTRIDGLLFAGILLLWSIVHDWRWTIRQVGLTAVLCLPWAVFATMVFGTVVPQSFVAKRAIYHFGVSTSAAPYLNAFTPFLEKTPARIAVKTVWFLFITGGLVLLVRRGGIYLTVALYFVFALLTSMLSGMMIFSWYLVPVVFAGSIGAAHAASSVVEWSRSRGPTALASASLLLALGFTAFHITALHLAVQRARETQGVENSLRRKIGEWLRENTPPRSTVLLEPIGYIGYYAGPERRILDEIGLVTPRIVPIRRAGGGWYVSALKTLAPDYLVQYASALELNRSEGTGDRLFDDDEQRAWFAGHYDEVVRFSVKGSFPGVDEKEKEYVVLKRIGE